MMHCQNIDSFVGLDFVYNNIASYNQLSNF